ncbi:Senecionine N-oxygenase [Exophiala xenobiotica]|uniref:glutaminase n=1 Tax=Lithohypha guttulata TaxID=1690604 RepID=A0ABR0KIA5_9EURO|nr:Senecionine N-oxygenase [Lithohypha guttulata]KAK5322785.1 Senecionine N-oxygenase [Exophiala xenobiotica]
MAITIGVLAVQGAFLEHITLLRKAAGEITSTDLSFNFIEVRTSGELYTCDALIIPGGESTTISLVAARTDLLDCLRDFVKVERKPVWGSCAGLILLSEAANSTKRGGQELIGGIDVRVNRNHFGRQIESFQADLKLPFLDQARMPADAFPGVFIRAPVVEKLLPKVEGVQADEQQVPDSVVAPSKQAKDEKAQAASSGQVEIMGVLPGRMKRAAEKGAEIRASEEAGDIIAVKQGNVFGTSFHPELTADFRIHVWWLQQVVAAVNR